MRLSRPRRSRTATGWGCRRVASIDLWRHPAELAAAASTFASIPILARHIPVSADDHQPDDVVGAVGSDVRFDDPFLSASLIVWAASAIRSIESGTTRELSSAYRYRCDLQPGRTPDGEVYDGVMCELIGNHLALVAAGRAGPDCVVGDGRIMSDAARRYRERFPDAMRLKA